MSLPDVPDSGAPVEAPAKTRRPNTWSEAAAPGLRDALAGGERRRAFVRHWTGQGPRDLRDIAFHHLFRILPADVASAIGGGLYRLLGPRAAPVTAARAAAHLRRIRPELTDPQVERLVLSHFESMGRVMAEFAVLPRLMREGRLTHEGAEIALAAQAAGPVIVLGCHTGNWEVIFPFLQSIGFTWAQLYDPPASRVRHAIATEVRGRFGAELVQPTLAGTRTLLKRLKQGGAVSIFVDEVYQGRVMAPFFGRPPHVDGNLGIVARLARASGARIVLLRFDRTKGCRFHVRVEGPIAIPSQADPAAALIDDVRALDRVIEPIIRAHCGDWYFLDNRFE